MKNTDDFIEEENKQFQQWHFDNGGALKLLQELLGLQPELLRVSSAYFDIGALKYVLDKMNNPFQMRLLIGFRDIKRAEETVRPALEQISEAVRNGLADEVIPASKIIHAAIVGHQVIVREFQARYRHNLHAKAYYADDKGMVLGSPNFSKAGLEHNVEGSIYITDPDALAYYLERYDYYFSRAHDITLEVKEILEKQLQQQPISPYEYYLLCLHHLYPKLKMDKSSVSSRKYHLAEYQTHMVIMARRMLDEQRRAMLISPTGTGKTVMGCRIASELREIGKINRALVIAPAGLVNKWKSHLLDFRFSADAYSMEILGHKNSFERDSFIYKLLESVDDKTLLIIDESQHFRNKNKSKNKKKDKRKGGLIGRVEQLLKIQSRADHPYSLALTATPYSTKWKDFQTQLQVIGKDSSIRDVEDLKTQPVLHITLPFIIQQYAKKDEQGIYLDFGGNKWRFSNIDVKPKIIFEYPHKDIISELEKLVFEFPKKQDPVKLPLFEWDNGEDLDDFEELDEETDEQIIEVFDNEVGVLRTRMPVAGLLKFSLSSFRAFLLRINNFLSTIDNYELLNREEVRERLLRIKQLTEKAMLERDGKADKLVELLKNIPSNEKILVFCEARETVKYLSEIVAAIRPDVKTVIGGMSLKEKIKIVKCFAPVANGNGNFDEDSDDSETNTLIATDCISEGLDFQDAHFLINYDLPWTPLTLVQRLGRLDRPTDYQRNFIVYNFVPQTEVSEMILKFMDTLTERADVYRTMAKINLLEEDKRTSKTMIENDPGFIKLFLGSDISYSDYASIRDKLVPIPVTDRLSDLANLTTEKRKEIENMPSRARSAMKAKNKDGYFILFSCREEMYVIIANTQGEIYPESFFETPTILLNQISCQPEEPLLPLPDETDKMVSNALRTWAERQNIEPEEITEIGTCALISSS